MTDTTKEGDVVERLARALIREHDEQTPEKVGLAMTAYNAGSFNVPYWDALAEAAIAALSTIESDVVSDSLADEVRAIAGDGNYSNEMLGIAVRNWFHRAALSTIESDVVRENAWRSIETAPLNTPVRVKVGLGMTFVARLVPEASVTSEEVPCDQWQAEHEGEYPECWHDGACWESNADERRSLQPSGWMALTRAALSTNTDEKVVG
jgi:hypothetical protein